MIPLGNHFECGAGMQCVILTAHHKEENLYLTCLLKKKILMYLSNYFKRKTF